MKKLIVGIAGVLAACTAGSTFASDEELRKAAQNPVANVISLPFQHNIYHGVGPDDETVHLLNIQPVYPLKIHEDWNLVTRTIIPIIHVPGSVEGLGVLPQGIGSDTETGLGDINFSAYFSPSKPKGFIWGAGPSLTIPTATDELLGSEKWSAGPAAVILKQSGKWTLGALARQLWSFAGKSNRNDVSQMLIQPFVNYNLADGWYLVSAPVITANWEQNDNDNRWVLPVGGGIGKLFSFGKQPINAQVSYYHNLETPELGAEGSVRIQVQFLFPQ